MVTGSRTSCSWRGSRSGVPSARLVVRRIGRGLGGASSRRGSFRPLGSRGVFSINARELLAIERALHCFAPQIRNSSVAIFADNSTAIAYLWNHGGTRSLLLNSIAQRILRWSETLPVQLTPQFIMGRHNVLADSLSRPNQGLGSEWTLKTEVFQELRTRWPVSIDLFATSFNHQCSQYFSPFHSLWVRMLFSGTDALLQS